MSFNSSDIQSFKNVWVFCEQRQGEMMPTTFELISEGRKLADELGVELCGILLGDNVDGIAADEVCRRAMKIAGEICVYTNSNVVLETLDT